MLQRNTGSTISAHWLQEGTIGRFGKDLHTSCENHCVPTHFISGELPEEEALEHFVKCIASDEMLSDDFSYSLGVSEKQKLRVLDQRSKTPQFYLLEVEGSGSQCMNSGCFHRTNDRYTISNTELLQRHTFTKCIVCAIVAQGFAIADLCSPAESYIKFRRCFNILSKASRRSFEQIPIEAVLSPLGCNPTKSVSNESLPATRKSQVDSEDIERKALLTEDINCNSQ